MNGHMRRSAGEEVCDFCDATIAEGVPYFNGVADICKWCIIELSRRLGQFQLYGEEVKKNAR